MIGTIQFVIITTIAMLLYTGGTYQNPSRPGYSFWENFFSDLGLTMAHSGQVNTISWFLFTCTAIIIGFCMILFGLTWISLFQAQRNIYSLSVLGSITLIISGIGFIGVALPPADLFLEPHIFFVRIIFVSTFLTSLCYSPALYLHPSYKKLYSAIFVGFSGIIFLYLGLLFFGPSSTTMEGLLIQATGQKIIGYIMGFVFFIQGYGAMRLVENKS